MGTPPVRSNLGTLLIAVSTAVRSKVTKTVSGKQLLRNNWSKGLSNSLSICCSTSLLLISPGLSWGSSSTSLLLIPPGPAHDCPALLWKPRSTPLRLISPGLSWGSSSTSLLLISPGPANDCPALLWEPSSTSLLLISPGLWRTGRWGHGPIYSCVHGWSWALTQWAGQSLASSAPNSWFCGHCLCDFVRHSCWKSKLQEYTRRFALASSAPLWYLLFWWWLSFLFLRVGALGTSYLFIGTRPHPHPPPPVPKKS